MQQNVDESLILNSVLKVPTERVFSYKKLHHILVSLDSDYDINNWFWNTCFLQKPLDTLIRSRMSVLKIVI